MTQFQPIMTQKNFVSSHEIFTLRGILEDKGVQFLTPSPLFRPVHPESER